MQLHAVHGRRGKGERGERGPQGRTLAGACWRVGKTQQCLLCRGQLANCRRGWQCIQIDSLVEKKTIERGNHKGMMATLLSEGGGCEGGEEGVACLTA